MDECRVSPCLGLKILDVCVCDDKAFFPVVAEGLLPWPGVTPRNVDRGCDRVQVVAAQIKLESKT